MGKVAILTDTNSGISPDKAKEMGIFLLPMSFSVNNDIFYEGIDLSYSDFFHLLEDKNTIPSTTQPSPTELTTMWNKILQDYESIVHIPMSSGLSASCESASALASSDYPDKVYVVDNHRISVTQYQSVNDALALAEAGYSAAQIKETLERESHESSIYIMVNTLKYLKMGGRITPAAAMIGSVLHLKPVLQIQGDKLDSYAKCRGEKSARRAMLDAIHHDVEGRFAKYAEKGEIAYHIAWSGADHPEVVQSWKEEVCNEFGLSDIEGMPLSMSVCCHIGPGALAVTCSHIVQP
ncbi:MAG: DegV family protein [Eubacterium sp.]|nr:DegV family protein [Eubacterium sp.]